MARRSPSYVCQSCGAVHTRWAGRCSSCEEWNSIIEEAGDGALEAPGTPKPARKGQALEFTSLSDDNEPFARISTNIGELDRVTGGGIVPASAQLIGGAPGVGKSTLLLQMAAATANSGLAVAYFSGEEASSQVRLRARRLGLSQAPVNLGAETNLVNILTTLKQNPQIKLAIVDSIQTLWNDGLEAAPGSVAQVRACTQSLISFAKKSGCAIILVGHVTKDGHIAGPKVIEHMVDTVLYFEGERGLPYRILRAVKNRFGPCDEIGVFEMMTAGLREVANPSELFLGERDEATPGSAVFAGMEGSRPILTEIQALVSPSNLGTPRRAVVGWDANRLNMVLAVLNTRCAISLADQDVYLNVAGGLKISEPAADLAAAAALLSSFHNAPLLKSSIFFGEISLSGAIRPTGHTTARLKEAQKLGFQTAVLPMSGDIEGANMTIALERRSHLRELQQDLDVTNSNLIGNDRALEC